MLSEHTIRLIEKYGGAVPRYTSYPTAVHFHAGFQGEQTAQRLKKLRTDAPVSVYVHIPFCHSLCHYCGCHTKIVNHTSVISSYVDTLCREISLKAALMPAHMAVSHVHFGGGSPNYAPIADIKRILDALRSSFAGTRADMAVDMECDPRLLTQEKSAALTHIGVARVSLGVQDFDESVQRAVNRIQPLAHVEKQVAALRLHGIKSINFDLITGLPLQTRDSVRNTLKETIRLRPDRVAVFAYAHVPWMKKHQRLLEKFRFPTPQERFSMHEMAHDMLSCAGYVPIGIDHYALPSDALYKAQNGMAVRRNFQGYTTDATETLLGFGLSAISQFKDAYAQNHVDATAYRQFVEREELPVSRGYALSEDDTLARDAIMQLMCEFRLDMKNFARLPVAHDRLEELVKDGIIVRENGIIRVTSAGKPFTRVVAACFDAHFLHNSEKDVRHAKAV